MLELKNISKKFPQPDGSIIEAIADISLNIMQQDFVAIVGPSGCGKTTLLKIIAGLEKPNSGQLIFDNKEIKSASQERGVVFQNFSSFPWLSVAENIAFGLRLKNFPEQKVEQIVSHYLKVTDLEQFKNVYPSNLSGGMQQRVAIARTLANDPKILLMDEPFGSLDTQTRSRMQEFLAMLWEQNHKTVIFVTHDIEEAIFLADKVILLTQRPAKIEKEFNIEFSRPRTHDLKFSNDFFDLKKTILKTLES